MRIQCPSCGTSTDLDPAFAGRKVLCATCDVKYIAPRWQGGPGQIFGEGSAPARTSLPPIDLPPIDLPEAAPPAAAAVDPSPAGAGRAASGPTATSPGATDPPAQVAPPAAAGAPPAGFRPVANLRGPDPNTYVKLAVDKGYVAAAQADRLRQAFEAAAGLGAAPPSVGEFLVARGIVTPEENRSLLLLLNQGSGKKSIRAAAIALLVAKGGRECPNCFEVNLPGARACRYCAVALSDAAGTRQCPSCFAAQPATEPVCRGCGADMATGLVARR